MKYEIIVSNLGIVHAGNNKKEYLKEYRFYHKAVLSPFGRASGENIHGLINGQIDREYIKGEA